MKEAAALMGAGIGSTVRPPAPPLDETAGVTVTRILAEAGLLSDQ